MPTSLPLPSRRAVVRRYGGPDVLQPDDGEAAAPGPGEVRIRQRAIGVNYLDVYLRKGWIPELLPLPGVPGMEAVGTVVDVGANVSGVLAGDRVAYLGPVPARIAACAPCRPTGSSACRARSRTRSRRRRSSRASPPTSSCATSATWAPERACSSTRRRAASACLSAPGHDALARP